MLVNSVRLQSPFCPGTDGMKTEYYWYRLHVTPRLRLFTPTPIEGGPDLHGLKDLRVTLTSPSRDEELMRDSWREVNSILSDLPLWTGLSVFSKVIIAEPCSRVGSSNDDAYLGHVPWTGTSPPLPTKLEDPSVFVRREDGVWCRRDTRNRMYPVNRQAERIAKPNIFSDGGSTSVDQQRPAS